MSLLCGDEDQVKANKAVCLKQRELATITCHLEMNKRKAAGGLRGPSVQRVEAVGCGSREK